MRRDFRTRASSRASGLIAKLSQSLLLLSNSAARSYLAQRPCGFQSEGLPAGCEESWITKTSDFRTAVPVMVSSIGTLGGAVAVPPAVALVTPAGVSRHCSPEIIYQPSGPGWTWTMDRS